MKGRPILFPDGKQISVLIPAEDFEVLDRVVQRAKRDDPSFTYGDQIREWVSRGARSAARRNGDKPLGKATPKELRQRQFHTIARLAHRLAKEELKA